MSRFRLPQFNIPCNITQPDVAGTPAIPTGPIRLANVPCALVYGARVNVASTGGTAAQGYPLQAMNLLVAKGTDIRGTQDVVSFDMVEVPAGSGRWYWAFFVDDIGRGWPNEHRTAGLLALMNGWTPPYP